MSAAKGRQSNASIHESYTCSEYLILPEGGNADSVSEHTVNPYKITEECFQKELKNLYMTKGFNRKNIIHTTSTYLNVKSTQQRSQMKSFNCRPHISSTSSTGDDFSPLLFYCRTELTVPTATWIDINHSPQCFRLHVMTETQREGNTNDHEKLKELLTFLFEGEIFCQMSTFMISTK